MVYIGEPNQRRRRRAITITRHKVPVCCGSRNKRRYRDSAQASDAMLNAQWARQDGLTHRHEMRSYFCPECGGIHLTSWTTYSAVTR